MSTLETTYNRILQAADALRPFIRALPEEQRQNLRRRLVLSPDQYAACKSLQTAAYAAGILSLEEAHTIHASLGAWNWQTEDLALQAAIGLVLHLLRKAAER